ncbi:hypothetical protein [Foetidibacter luteolus]|uniref:hypothetical protein n=1 Tax=Foetidibacter luteolus TaxID=2608880 RepID=UPI00129BDBB1|nr:hypothetical protein [Foetidibacter luteolus]
MSNINDNKIKHLEFIQLTITRMNVNSFLVKGWLVTLVAAIFVLSEKDANTKFLWFAPFVSILFWILDAFFIVTERKYRCLYDQVRTLTESQINYSMDVSSFEGGKNSFFRCLLSLTLLLFYPIIIAASILASSFINQ